MTPHVLILAVVAAAALQQVPARPNFAGEWELAQDRSSQTMKGSVVTSVSGLLGDRFTAVHDEKMLSMRMTVSVLQRDIRVTYNLDGSESKNLNPVGGGQPDEAIFSRVTWEGDKLVIHTRGTTLVNGKPQESKRVIWIDSEGLLTIERSAEGQPTTRSVYRRIGHAEPTMKQ